MIDNVNKILSERGDTHGDFSTNTRIMQTIKREMRCEPKWDTLKNHQAEALDMIAHKIGRILAGDPNFKDHWDDIAGYATLVANRCNPPQTAPELGKPRCTICGICIRLNAAGYAMCQFESCPNAGKKVV